MSENLNKLPENIKEHISQMARASGNADQENYMEAMAGGWLEKKDHFEKETELIEMVKADTFEKDNPNGVLVMTYSGSLLNIGPAGDNGRRVEYNSIGLRTDVPETLAEEDCELAADIELDEIVRFLTGPIKTSSPAYSIAIMKEDLVFEEQEEKLAEVTQVLADEFLDVNKTIITGSELEEMMNVV